MRSWPIKKMKELCKITSSKRIFRSDYVMEGVPFYRGKEITEKFNGNLDVTTELFITKEKFDEIKHKFGAPEPGDVLLTSVGTLGSVYVVKLGDHFYFKDGNITWFRNLSDLDSNFFFYWLSSPQGKGELQKCTIGSSQSAFTIVLLKGMTISLPPLPTQRKIASILSAYDDLIENNLRRIKILEEMAQNLYREWFVKFRFPGHEKIKFVDSSLGKIPEGWEVESLSDLVSTQYGYTESAQKNNIGPKFLRGKDINKTSYIDWHAVPYCPISSKSLRKYQLSVGDIVVIRMADPGKIGIVEEEVNAVFASYLVRLSITSTKLLPYYLFYLLTDKRYQGYITGVSTGTTRKSASAGVLTGISLVIPPEPVLLLFEDNIKGLRKLITNLLSTQRVLRQTRDLLLPKLISGKLDVSDLDIQVSEDTA